MTLDHVNDILGNPDIVKVIDQAIQDGAVDYVERNMPHVASSLLALIKDGGNMRTIKKLIRTAERSQGKQLHPIKKWAIEVFAEVKIAEHKRGVKNEQTTNDAHR